MTWNLNSKHALDEMKRENKISPQQNAILELLDDGVARTSRQISKSLDMERSSVTGRLNSLIEKNIAQVKHNRPCPITSKTVSWYSV